MWFYYSCKHRQESDSVLVSHVKRRGSSGIRSNDVGQYVFSQAGLDVDLLSFMLQVELAACPPWINVVYLVYSLVTHVYFKSTTFPQGAADQTVVLHELFLMPLMEMLKQLAINSSNVSQLILSFPEERRSF